MCSLICWSFAATAHKNPPEAIQPIPIPLTPGNICLENLDPNAAPHAIPQLPNQISIRDVVLQKIANRTAALTGPDDYLISDQYQDDGKKESPINEGITRLFIREIVERMRRDYRANMGLYAREWFKERKKLLESEQSASSAKRVRKKDAPLIFLDPEADGTFKTDFTDKYRAGLDEMIAKMDEAKKADFFSREKGGVRVQEMELKEYLVKTASFDLASAQKANPAKGNLRNSMLYDFEQSVNKLISEIVEGKKVVEDAEGNVVEVFNDPNGMINRYMSGLDRNPNWALFEVELQKTIDKFLAELNEKYPIANPKGFKLTLVTPKARDYVQLNKQGKISVTFPDIVLTYEKEIASLVLTSPQGNKPGQRVVNLVQLHGTGSNYSNVASWGTLEPRAIQSWV